MADVSTIRTTGHIDSRQMTARALLLGERLDRRRGWSAAISFRKRAGIWAGHGYYAGRLSLWRMVGVRPLRRSRREELVAVSSRASSAPTGRPGVEGVSIEITRTATTYSSWRPDIDTTTFRPPVLLSSPSAARTWRGSHRRRGGRKVTRWSSPLRNVAPPAARPEPGEIREHRQALWTPSQSGRPRSREPRESGGISELDRLYGRSPIEYELKERAIGLRESSRSSTKPPRPRSATYRHERSSVAA